MILIETAKSGLSVLRKDGRLLDSTVDPQREAIRLVDRLKEDPSSYDALIALGFGSGWHLVEFKRRHPKTPILIIEADEEIAKAGREIQPELAAIPLIVGKPIAQLSGDPLFVDAVGSVYRVFPHAASLQMQAEYYLELQTLLLGRDKIAFLNLLKTRPDLLALFDPAAISALGAQTSDQAASIITVCSLFHPRHHHQRERRMWRLLEELIS